MADVLLCVCMHTWLGLGFDMNQTHLWMASHRRVYLGLRKHEEDTKPPPLLFCSFSLVLYCCAAHLGLAPCRYTHSRQG